MYFCIAALTNVSVGEMAILKRGQGGELGCYLLDGTYIGYVCGRQPEGCMDFWEMASEIGSKKIICNVAIKANRVFIMKTDSRTFVRDNNVSRVEVESYGVTMIA